MTIKNHAQTPLMSVDTISPPLDLSMGFLAVVPHERLGTLAVTHSQVYQSKNYSGVGELVRYLLSAGVVVTVYIVIPLVTTLVAILPNTWSRVLMTLEFLAVCEFAICRILMKTSRKHHV